MMKSQQDKRQRDDFSIDPYSCFSSLSDSLNSNEFYSKYIMANQWLNFRENFLLFRVLQQQKQQTKP